MSLNGYEKRFPLSLSQWNILNLERVLGGTSVNNISTTVRITGRLDFPVLQQSISLVIEHDPTLRTRLTEADGTVSQYHASFEKETFPVYDFSNTSKEGIENWETAVTRELIPLFDGPLYRFILFRDSENGGGVLVKLHHIIADGWSQIMLCNKIGQTYLDLLTGNIPDLPDAPDYELHVIEEQEYLASKAFKKDEKYWKEIVSHAGEPSVLKPVSSSAVSPVGRRISFDLPEILNHAIHTYCLKHRIAPFAVFYMALAIYFKRNGGADNFTIGVPIFNRTNYEFKQSMGMFVTTLPFYNEIDDEWTLDQFNEELAERWFDMLHHQRYPFSKICELSGREGRLFNIALSYQDSKIFESSDASVMFSGRWHYCGYQAEQLAIHLTNLKNHCSYAVDYDYLAQLFTEAEITELHKNLCHILSEALNEPDRPIYRLNILSLEQKEELLYKFNQTDRYLEERSVYEALLENNARCLNRVALIHNGERMTYGTLFHHGTQFASQLAAIGVGEALVAVLLPRGFELIAAMVGAMQINCAYMLLSESLPTDRIKHILGQSGAAAVITDIKGNVRLEGCGLPVICVDEMDITSPGFAVCPNDGEALVLPGDKLAYVVYTSGSTGEPKGVEITQRNLLNLAQEMESVYGQGAVLSVSNVGFDAFMLESIVALLNGRTIVLPAESDLESPESLASLMNSYAVDFFSMTPSRLSAFMQNNAFRKVMWRMESIVCGGEPFPPELLKKLKSCTKARVYNQYGPSETTVAVSMKEISRTDKITIGTPMGNCKLYILDQWMNPLPIGGNGKLFVGGKCVGRGYRNCPELTEKAFRNSPFINDDRIYDTGDMAYWTPGGEVILTGRADRQVKLNGLRIELQEISSCIETYRGVTHAYARVCKIGENKILGVYYSSNIEISEPELLSHAATYLPRYMIPAFFIRVDAFPTTANGKIDEARLPMPQNTGESSCLIVSQTAHRITEILREVLSYSEMNAESDYFLCGGNSLNALAAIVKIEESFGVKIRVSDLYACRTPIRLAAFIDGTNGVMPTAVKHTPAAATGMKKAAAASRYSLTAIQQGIYIQSQLDRNGVSYNMPGAFLMEKEPDVDKLSAAFNKLISTDAVFRTSFLHDTDGVHAVVSERVDFELETISAQDFDSASNAFLKPFDLSRAPLLRAGVWRSSENKWYLFVDCHHIIGDGMSTSVLLQRLDMAYRGIDFSVDWDYFDYILAEESADKAVRSSTLNYWTEHLKNLPEPLDLPTDYSGPKNFDYKGAVVEYCLNDAESTRIKTFCQEHGYSEYVIFLAAYGLLLSGVSGSKDMIIGTPVAGRTRSEYSQIIGPFINTLPVRLKIDSEQTVDDYLKQVQQEVTGMIDHQNVGLEEIISAMGLERGAQNSLYRVMMSHSPVDENSFMLDGGALRFCSISTGSVKMDLVMELVKQNDHYLLRFSYATSLFDEETIRFYGRCIANTAEQLSIDKERAISVLSLMSAADKETYLEAPNMTITPFFNRPIHRKLKSCSMLTPDKTAVICRGKTTTYAELERRACAIARFLEEKGVETGACVALCVKRSADMLAAMYGILKAGCSYMFLLDSFPAARQIGMLNLAQAALLICDSETALSQDAEYPCEICMLPMGEAEDYVERRIADDSLVNILFTSGTTGEPKGVMLRHRSVTNLCAQIKTLFGDIEGSVLCSTNTVFDCFLIETLIPLALGRTVVMADEEEMLLPWKLAELIENCNAEIIQMTPSRLQMCFSNNAFCSAAKHIRMALLGGEILTESLRDTFYRYSDGKLMNMYGPTESTILTTMGYAEPGKHITIGMPMQNARAYVLDAEGNPVLPTACGELYIAGECLAAGYSSRPEMTDALFVDDPFFPGEIMYRSGDIVRRRMDGRFDYIGRKDMQIKLNGQRVELSEIMSAINQSGLVTQSAVIPMCEADGSMALYAFYVDDSCTCSAEALTECISQVLPAYMVPSKFIRVDSIPMTATAKTDTEALRRLAQTSDHAAEEAFDLSSASDVQTSMETVPADESAAHMRSMDAQNEGAPTSDAEPAEIAPAVTQVLPNTKAAIVPDMEYVLSVWRRVLGQETIDTDASFFVQGGTSMSALSVIINYYSDGFEMSMTDFYSSVTPRKQAAFLTGKYNVIVPAEDRSTEMPASALEKSVFITGASGFLGIHLLHELTQNDGKRIFCLLRSGGRQRLENEYRQYFDETLPMNVTVLNGDVTLDRLGLSESEYTLLTETVGEIYHCVADVRHYADHDDNHFKVNVGGTERVLDLARSAEASVYHISTCSLCGEYLKKDRSAEAVFTEEDFDIGQNWEDNIYVKTKYLAEELVHKAAKEGLSVKIFRLGRLVGRMTDGKYQTNRKSNTFYHLIDGLLRLGAIPMEAAAMPVDLTPVDLCAKEIALLKNSEDPVYHILCDAPPTLFGVLFALDHTVRVVSEDAFLSMLKTQLTEEPSESLAVVMNEWLTYKANPPRITVSNTKTVAALKHCGFEIPGFSVEVVLKEFGKE